MKKILSIFSFVFVLLAFSGLPANAAYSTVYDNTPSPIPGNLPSLGYEATSTSEFGGLVQLAGTERQNPKITVLMSSWACQNGSWTSGNCSTESGATFNHPITINLYSVNSDNSVGSLITSKTQNFDIPYRPSSDPVHCTDSNAGKWYDGTNCYNGKTTPITFDILGTTLPDKVIVSVAYSTTHYGSSPLGQSASCFGTSSGCGYDSLNVALKTPPTIGSLPLPNDAFLNSSWAGAYCPGSQVPGSFHLDAGCWTQYQPSIKIESLIPILRSATITSPTTNQEVYGNVNFAANLVDDDVDAIQWAIRQGTCAANTSTVFGNVDGHNDSAIINTSNVELQTFSFTADMSTKSPGMYCFVYNPTEDAGETDLRKTVQFQLVAPPVDLCSNLDGIQTVVPDGYRANLDGTCTLIVGPPTSKDQCKDEGWKTFNNPVFKNQGDCVSSVQSNPNAKGNNK